MKTHYRQLMDMPYLGAYSLADGKDMILTIKEVRREEVTGEGNRKEMCIVASFKENQKSAILNATNCKTIAKLYRSNFIEDWKGRSIQFYVAEVKAFGDTIDALRIRNFVPKVTTISKICSDCNQEIKQHEKYTPEQIATSTYNRFGKAMCFSCGEIAKSLIVEAVNPFETPPVTETTEPESTVTEETF